MFSIIKHQRIGFFQEFMIYLGHFLSSDNISTDPDLKKTAVKSWSNTTREEKMISVLKVAC